MKATSPRKKLIWRSALVALAVLLLVFGAWAYFMNYSNRVTFQFKGLVKGLFQEDSPYSSDEADPDHVALFRLKNHSSFPIYVLESSIRAGKYEGGRLPGMLVRDESWTNHLVFRRYRSISLEPGKEELIAFRAFENTHDWQTTLSYSSGNFRARLAWWLGPTLGGSIASSSVRTAPKVTLTRSFGGPTRYIDTAEALR